MARASEAGGDPHLAHLIAACDALQVQLDELWEGLPLDADAAAAAARLAALLGEPPDLVVQVPRPDLRLLYLRTTVDMRRLEDAVLPSLTALPAPSPAGSGAVAAKLAPVATYAAAIAALASGCALVLRDGNAAALSADVSRWPTREPGEPPGEIIAQGPHTGFVETLETNLALIRQRIRDRRLRWRSVPTGARSATTGALLYMEGLCRPAVLAEVVARLQRGLPSFATDGGMLAQRLTPKSYLFPTIGSTERPDTAVAALLEGRVAILTEGSPVALLLPQVFAHLLHVPEDYYNRSYSALMERALRFAGLLVALTASPLYVALATVNLELVPTPLFISIAQARANVPIPTLAEVLGLEMLVEVIRQAGLRLPSTFGQPVSIIGAVVVGQSAVVAGLVSAPAVVVVSLSFIVSFILPAQDGALAMRAVRYPLILLAAAFGLFGIVWGLFVLFVYLAALESFGVPYLAPVSPLRPRGLQDVVGRAHLSRMRRSFLAVRPGRGGDA
jgi:hypothetical protein